MSHFTVAVITETKPTQSDLEAALAPWHQFECTGLDDKYVQDIDRTSEHREQYESSSEARLKGPDGALYRSSDDRFYRDPTAEELAEIGPLAGTGAGHGMSWRSQDWRDGRGWRTKVRRFIPHGFSQVEVPLLHLMSFREYVAYETSEAYEVLPGAEPDLSGAHKYGHTLLADDRSVLRVIERTNPNYHWDWWKVGGRWTGMLKLLPGKEGVVGEPGILTDPARDGHVDSAAIGDIDIDGMRDEKGKRAGAAWDRFRSIVGPETTWRSWSDVFKSADFVEARQIYWAQDALVRLEAAGEAGVEFRFDADDYLKSRDAHVAAARAGALTTHAVVKDGVWYERGSMGWWGCVSDDIGDGDWNGRFAELLDGLALAWITIVDCHV